MAASTKFVQRVAHAFRTAGGHDSVTISGLDILRAVPGKVEARLPIQAHNLNRLGSVHGGLVSTLVDTGGSLAISSHGYYATGVTTDLHATFVKPAGGKGDELRVLAEVISLGKVMATTRIELRHPITDALLGAFPYFL